jgi:hypothetical protein
LYVFIRFSFGKVRGMTNHGSRKLSTAVGIAIIGALTIGSLADAAPSTTIAKKKSGKSKTTTETTTKKKKKSSSTTGVDATTTVVTDTKPDGKSTTTIKASSSSTKAPSSSGSGETTTTKKGATAPASGTAKAGVVFIPGAGRVLDLNANEVAKLAEGKSVPADVRGASGLAASGAGSVIVDVTVSNPSAPGKITLTPVAPDFARTVVAANIAFPASATTVTRVAVPVGSAGKVRVTSTAGPSGLAISVVGWVVPAPAGTVESAAIPLDSCRLVDTASGQGGYSGEVTNARPFDVPAVNIFKVPPALGGAQVPTGVILSVTASQASGPLDLTITPTGSPSPALTLSMNPIQTTSGIMVVPVGTDARARFDVTQNGVQLSADVLGWLDRDGVAKTAGPC